MFYHTSNFTLFFFHLIGQRAPRDITLSAFNWSKPLYDPPGKIRNHF